MKIDKVLGEFAFKALCKFHYLEGWEITSKFFFSLEEVRRDYETAIEIKWPVELQENGVVYIPAPEELE